MLKKNIIIAIVLIFTVGATVGLLVWRRPGLLPFTVQNACQNDTDITGRYTFAYNTADIDTIKDINEEIKSRSGYKNDATCQYILLRYSVLYESGEQITAAYESMQALIEKGESVSSELDDGVDHEEFLHDVKKQVEYINDTERAVDG